MLNDKMMIGFELIRDGFSIAIDQDDTTHFISVPDETGEGYIHEARIRISLVEDSDNETIGYITGYVINQFQGLEDAFYALDGISQGTNELWNLLTSNHDIPYFDDTDSSFDMDLFYLASIEIKEELRNKGIGTAIMQNILKLTGKSLIKEFGGVVLKAFPIYGACADSEEKHKKLVEFYEKTGFRKVNSNYANFDGTFMFKNWTEE